MGAALGVQSSDEGDSLLRIPASCTSCGLIFPSGIVASTGSRIDISSSSSQCPRCGSMAHIVGGIMEILDRAVRLVSGPDFTRDTLLALGVAVEDVRSGRQTAHQAAASLQRRWPSLAKEFREWSGWGIGLLGLMLSVYSILFDHKEKPATNTTAPEEAAMEVDRYITSNERFHWSTPMDHPVNPPAVSPRPEARPKTEPHKENRKQRRAKRSQERRHRRKH